MRRDTASGWSATRSTTASPTASEATGDRRATYLDQRRRRRQLVLQVLGDDGLAARLAGAARTTWSRAVDALAGNVALCPPALAQHAGVAAFSPEGYAAARGRTSSGTPRRASTCSTRLPELGWSRIAPADGAFYLYGDISASGLDSITWCARLLDEAGVALTPGTDFDPVDGHDWVRLSFASSVDVVRAAVDRIVAWQRTLDPAP